MMKRRDFMVHGLASAAVATGMLPWRALADALRTSSLADADVDALAARLKGQVHLPGSAGYDRLRRIYAAKADLHPALMVHVRTADDVRHAVDFARANALPLAVRCGGHSYAGHGLCTGGLVIDMSGLRTVVLDRDTGIVRVGGGCLVGGIDRATAAHGLATVLGQCPSVGIGGFALGGGVGPLMGRHGLGCDNVLAVEMVLADGRRVVADADRHADLFWALRGGGGNFGVATAFTLKTHPVREILGGNLVYRMDEPAAVLRFYREATSDLPDELTVLSMIVRGGEDRQPVLIAQATWNGHARDGERAMARLRDRRFLLADGVARRPYLDLQSETPAEIPPSLHENRTGFVAELGDPVIQALVDALDDAPSNLMIGLVHLHGAVIRTPVNATAFPLRRTGIAWGVTGLWRAAADRDRTIHWVRASAAALAPHGGGAYVNGMDEEGTDAVRAAYGEQYARLAALKATFDPDNLFARNQNILPATT